MMLYLTGASSSLAKSSVAPQSDVTKSLGGYISSNNVPNSDLNGLFDLISSHTIEKRLTETIAIALINQLSTPVKNVTLKIVCEPEDQAFFKIGAVTVGTDYMMEQIANRYQQPLACDFYDASFNRGAVDLKIKQYASVREEIMLYPFNVSVSGFEDSSMDATWNAFEKAFENNNTYTVKRIYEDVFRIERLDETVISTPFSCSYITTEGFSAEFNGQFKNSANNEVTISDWMDMKQAVGLWLQRNIRKSQYPTNEKIMNDYLNGYIKEDNENISFIISWEIPTTEEIQQHTTA